MDDFLKGDSGAVYVFLYLLPGFLGVAIYDYLVEGQPREIFDKIVFALSVALISYLVVRMLSGMPLVPAPGLGKDSSPPAVLSSLLGRNLVYVSAVSVALSIVLAFLTNYGIPLWIFRSLKLTYKTSSVDVWQDTFYRFRGYWVKITYADGKELIGWPQYFSAVGKPRELFLRDATWWLVAEDGEPTSIDVDGPGVYISDFTAVTAIQLLEGTTDGRASEAASPGGRWPEANHQEAVASRPKDR
jgi:hypothetical protein